MFEGPVAEQVQVGPVHDVLDELLFLFEGEVAVAFDFVNEGEVEVQLVRRQPVDD